MSPTLSSVVAFAAALLLAPLAGRAFACSCMSSGPPCQSAFTADAVFSGTVRSVEFSRGGERDFFDARVSFEVDRGYVNATIGRVDVVTSGTSAACGYSFTVGKRYLVYAHKSSVGLVASICSRTRPIEQAAEDIAYLRTVPPRGTGGRLYGRINEWGRHPAEEHGADYGPLAGIQVTVDGLAMHKSTVTDAHGRYEVTDLPVGKAVVMIVPPAGFDSRYVRREFEIRDLRACSVADFELSPRATASGTVVDAGGRPLAGIDVDAVSIELAGFTPPAYHTPAKTDERGRFEFDALPPGEYVFGVNLTKRYGKPPPGVSVFLPGVGGASKASIVELAAGDEKFVGTLRLPPR
jgi:hypothetical protein